MVNKAKDGWYAPLAAQFQGMDEPMPLARFAAIEAVLHLLALNAPAASKSLSFICPISAYWHNGVYKYGTHFAAGPARIGLLSFSKILAG